MTNAPYFVEFTVYGKPITQGSKRIFHGNIVDDNSAALRIWRREVASNARLAMAGLRAFERYEPIRVSLVFVLSKPASSDATPTRKPDLDKLERAIFDALTDSKLIYDDAQVIQATAIKRYARRNEIPGVRIQVVSLTNTG